MAALDLATAVLRPWSTTTIQILVSLAAAALLTTLLPLLWRPALPSNAPRLFPGLPLVGAARDFYQQRATFTARAHAAASSSSLRGSSSSSSFTTYVGRYPVVCPGGAEGRAAFFGARDADLNLFAGYGLLKNGLPPINLGGGGGGASHSLAEGHRLLDERMRQAREYLPAQVGEVQARLRRLFLDGRERESESESGRGGAFDPREAMFRVAFAVNMRQYGANELMTSSSDDDDDDSGDGAGGWSLEWTRDKIETLRSGTSAAPVVAPLLWPLAMVRNVVAGLRLMRAVRGIRAARRRTGRREDDWMQQLIDAGQSDAQVLGAIMAALFASYFNVGMAATWLPLYVATNRRWYGLLEQEVLGVVARHREGPGQTSWEVLSTLPLEAWERDFPVLQLCLHETLRFTDQTAMYRKNTSGRDIPLGKTGEVIPRDAYVAYTLDEVHMDPKVYENPLKWDPSRYQGEKSQSNERYTYVAWGGGRHLCAGMRFAKLILAIIIAHFVSAVDFEAVDKDGKVVTEQPRMSREGVAPIREDIVRLRFRMRNGAVS